MNNIKRTRRLRRTPALRNLVAETSLSLDDLVYPIFVEEGENIKTEIESMEDNFRYSIDRVYEELDDLQDLGINKVLLFGIPRHKDDLGSGAYADDGVVQEAIRFIKKNYEDFIVITDVCMCEYTANGHCGILDDDNNVDNDQTLDYLVKIALSHARAGADIIAPSDMMDGRIGAIRQALDREGFTKIPIMAYSAKFASSFYGPFREAADSAPAFGDRKTYQMDYRNSDEALREHQIDIEEGADIIMVKPGLAYLDIIQRTSDTFGLPLAVYNVSGEYSMIKNAIKAGLVDEDIIEEVLIAFKRAGAKIIISYFAKDYARRVKDHGQV